MKGISSVALGDFCQIESGYAFKSERFTENPDDICLVKGSNLGHKNIDWLNGPKWPAQEFDSLKRYELVPDDVVIAMDRPIVGGNLKFAWIQKNDPKSLLVQRVARLRSRTGLDQGYLRCVIADPAFKAYIDTITTGVNVPHISGPDMRRYRFPLPPLPTQQKIAHILSAYDDLIENNLKRIKLLEEMAQITYEEWFVRMKFPGHETTPIDAETGLPEGWSYEPFADLIDFKEGPGLRNWQYRDVGIPFLNIRVIKDNEIDFSNIKYLDPEEVNQKYLHFLLKENDHVISTSGTLGRLLTIRACHLPVCLNTSIIRMRQKSVTGRIGTWQIKHMLTGQVFQAMLEVYASGAAQVNFGPMHLNQIKLKVPNNELASLYEQSVSPIEESIKNFLDQNIRLKEARDILLPRLMTGMIDVDHIELPKSNPDTEAA